MAKKSKPIKKAVTKKTAKKAVARSASPKRKKATAKRAAVKKATPKKKIARKAAAKKTAPKRTTKKQVVRAVSFKKKKTTAGKAAVKKAMPVKAVAKKAAVKKAIIKKMPPQRTVQAKPALAETNKPVEVKMTIPEAISLPPVEEKSKELAEMAANIAADKTGLILPGEGSNDARPVSEDPVKIFDRSVFNKATAKGDPHRNLQISSKPKNAVKPSGKKPLW